MQPPFDSLSVAVDLSLIDEFLYIYLSLCILSTFDHIILSITPDALYAEKKARVARFAQIRQNVAMLIGSCVIELQLPGVHSLKEKRSIIKSLLARLPRKFNVAVSEVGYHEQWQGTALGIVTVGTDGAYLQGLLEKTVLWIEKERPDLPLLDYTIEIL